MARQIRIAKIIHHSYSDGPGPRTVLYVQGCPIRCPGCQSPHLWNHEGGTSRDIDDVAAELLDTGLPVTISGGEPMAQAEAVADLLATMRVQRPNLHIVLYSGFVLEDLVEIAPAIPAIMAALYQVDVLVDGPFMPEFDDDLVQWRGSRNQRVIDLGHRTGFGLLDWDTPTLTVTEEGDVVGAADLVEQMFGSRAQEARMCGQTREA